MSDLFDLTDVEAQFFAEGDALWLGEGETFSDLEADAQPRTLWERLKTDPNE